MAALAFGLAGAALGGSLIGNFALFGATFSGSSIGWSLGSMLGGQMFKEDLPTINQQGPRISDFRIQSSTYGQSIPRVFGRARLAGNLIWTSGIIETANVSSQTIEGGKGGGGDQTIVTTTYTYSIHLAIGVCEGPISGVRKIWADGRLIYSVGAGAAAESIYASNSRADAISIYTGTSSQPINPLVESYVGAGNAPAYRNLAYVVLNNFQLADFGNRIPNFEFEVMESASAAVPATLGDSGLLAIVTGSNQVRENNGLVECVATTGFTATTIAWTVQRSNLAGTVISTQSGSTTDANSHNAMTVFGNWLGLWVDRIDGKWKNFLTGESSDVAFTSAEWNNPHTVWRISATAAIALFSGARPSGPTVNWSLRRLSATDSSAGVTISTAGPDYGGVPNAAFETVLDLGLAQADSHQLSSYWDGSSFWLADLNYGNLYQYSPTLTLLATYTFTPLANVYRPILIHGGRFYIGRSFGDSTSYLYSLNGDLTTTLLGSGSVEGGSYSQNFPTASVAIGTVKIVSLTPLLTDTPVSLDDCVTALCTSAGLSASDINVTALSSTTLNGYIRGRRASLRAALEPLMAAFFFDAVESDGKLKFILRSGSSIVTIDEDDLAAREAGGEPGSIVEYTRTEELSLPNEISVGFINDTTGYQLGAQYARRLAASSDGQLSMELPIVLTDPEAKSIADASLYDAWRAREQYAFRTSRKFAKYEPGDVVTIPHGGDLVDVRITQRDDGANGVIEWHSILAESSVYTQTAATQEAEAASSAVGIAGPTALKLLDIPQLRDEFDRYGFYAAAHGWLSGWRGAALYRSVDAGGSYAPVEEGVFVSAVTAGIALGALGAPLISEQFDEKCTVSVQLHSGSPASVSRADVLNGANFCLLGDELLQFRDATQTAANTYKLSGLLRGRFGTERAMTTHVAGDRFVLLTDATVRFVSAQDSDVGFQRIYRAPSLGNLLQTASEELLTYEGVNLKPLSPAHLRGGRNASSDIVIAWTRRTRGRATWRDFVDAPLAEASEAYEVDIFDGADVVRTLSASSATVTYTAAQQTTDFGSPQASVDIEVYQVSERVGRGFAASATV